jgi:prepilin-type N-terminal cleavage/methylation domain-containing protein
MAEKIRFNRIRGFSLIETMVALILLASGILAAAPLLTIAASSDSLGRSKGAAAIAARDTLESLADIYRRNPSAEELRPGTHGPVQREMINPCDGTVLNRFDLIWIVSPVPDPRPNKAKDTRLVRVVVTPVLMNGTKNIRGSLNKILNVSTIFSLRMK